MNYGYIRVSTKEQHTDRQLVCIRELVADTKQIFCDKQSGKDFDRPEYNRLLKKLKPGDTLIVKSIDRLGRNYDEILQQWHLITKVKKADIFVIDFPLLDTRKKDNDLTGTFIADLVLQILSYVAQTEREFLHQRQAEGIAVAKQKGVVFGRRRVMLPPEFEFYAEQYINGKLSLAVAADELGMNKTTFYRNIEAIKKG